MPSPMMLYLTIYGGGTAAGLALGLFLVQSSAPPKTATADVAGLSTTVDESYPERLTQAPARNEASASADSEAADGCPPAHEMPCHLQRYQRPVGAPSDDKAGETTASIERGSEARPTDVPTSTGSDALRVRAKSHRVKASANEANRHLVSPARARRHHRMRTAAARHRAWRHCGMPCRVVVLPNGSMLIRIL